MCGRGATALFVHPCQISVPAIEITTPSVLSVLEKVERLMSTRLKGTAPMWRHLENKIKITRLWRARRIFVKPKIQGIFFLVNVTLWLRI